MNSVTLRAFSFSYFSLYEALRPSVLPFVFLRMRIESGLLPFQSWSVYWSSLRAEWFFSIFSLIESSWPILTSFYLESPRHRKEIDWNFERISKRTRMRKWQSIISSFHSVHSQKKRKMQGLAMLRSGTRMKLDTNPNTKPKAKRLGASIGLMRW